MDHAVFRSWCPHCVKDRAEACGHRRRGGETGDVPTVSLDYTHRRSEQEKEEKGMPIDVVKDSRTKMVMAKAVPSKGVQKYAVEVVRKFVEQLGRSKAVMKSTNEPAIFALREAVRRGTGWRPPGKLSEGERCEERAGPVPGVEGRVGE